MRRHYTHKTLRVVALAMAFTGPAFAAKTLVFCSEGSPEGFKKT